MRACLFLVSVPQFKASKDFKKKGTLNRILQTDQHVINWSFLVNLPIRMNPFKEAGRYKDIFF